MGKKTWWDYLPENVQNGSTMLTEDDFWEAIAEMKGLDVSEIADGDPIEYL